MRLFSTILPLACSVLLASAQKYVSSIGVLKLTSNSTSPISPEPPIKPLSSRLYTAIKSTLIGPPPIDYTLRDQSDKENGIIRLTDRNYAEKVEQGDPKDVWVVVLYVPLHLLTPNFQRE